MITLCCRFKSLCSCFVSLCSQRTSLCGRCASLCSRFNRHLSGCLACINGSFMFFCSCFIDLNKLTNVRDPGFTYSCCCLFFVLGCLIHCLVLNLWFCEVCIQHTTFVRLLSAVDHLKDFLICTKVPLLTKSTEIRHPRHYLLYYVCNNNVTRMPTSFSYWIDSRPSSHRLWGWPATLTLRFSRCQSSWNESLCIMKIRDTFSLWCICYDTTVQTICCLCLDNLTGNSIQHWWIFLF